MGATDRTLEHFDEFDSVLDRSAALEVKAQLGGDRGRRRRGTELQICGLKKRKLSAGRRCHATARSLCFSALTHCCHLGRLLAVLQLSF
jgi:hypothetical protein